MWLRVGRWRSVFAFTVEHNKKTKRMFVSKLNPSVHPMKPIHKIETLVWFELIAGAADALLQPQRHVWNVTKCLCILVVPHHDQSRTDRLLMKCWITFTGHVCYLWSLWCNCDEMIFVVFCFTCEVFVGALWRLMFCTCKVRSAFSHHAARNMSSSSCERSCLNCHIL